MKYKKISEPPVCPYESIEPNLASQFEWSVNTFKFMIFLKGNTLSYYDWLLYRPASMESYIRHTHSLNLTMNDQQRLQFSKVWFKIFLTYSKENSIYVFP